MDFANSVSVFSGAGNSKEMHSKKSGHSHTYTHIDEPKSEKCSQI